MKSTTLLALALLMLPVACTSNDSLSGTYVQIAEISPGRTMELATMEFSPNGKVLISNESFGGGSGGVEVDYEVEGARLKIKTPDGQVMVFERADDGTFRGPGGAVIKPKEG